MGRVTGKVAVISGAARGQGRSHARMLAAEGADIIAVDLCADIDTNEYPLARPEDLDETARLVEKEGQRAFTAIADVRDRVALSTAIDEGVSELGHLDIAGKITSPDFTRLIFDLIKEPQSGPGIEDVLRDIYEFNVEQWTAPAR